MTDVTVGLIGAGAIGRFHAETIARSGIVRLVAVSDPTPAAAALAATHGVPAYADHRELLAREAPQAVIVATPNASHVAIALDAIEAGVVPLVEKPVADTVQDGERLAEASARCRVPVLVGHHRRHNPVIAAAREAVRGGSLGRLVTVTVLAACRKHDAYYDVPWRREPGGGPILINLIHEIDLIRYVCGEIASVGAITSHEARGLPVEDTAAVMLRLANGAVVTISLSDAVSSPWSWDLASGELPLYPAQPEPVTSHHLCGTEGSLTLPGLKHWRYEGKRSWFEPMVREALPIERDSPYTAQLRHLRRVVRGEERPIVDAADATRTLRATLAVGEAARTRRIVDLETGPC